MTAWPRESDVSSPTQTAGNLNVHAIRERPVNELPDAVVKMWRSHKYYSDECETHPCTNVRLDAQQTQT